ncbi:MAG: GNAT family N-acetyltransferase, partial [Gammaproteobacteria bacterium]|nr:GNAT family N-acetyltransferase [Gammaproteobacteria bacterium]
MPENDLGKRFKIKVADWKTDKSDLKHIRRLIFIEEQNVPEELEWDEFDDSSIHFLATLDEKVVAVARLKPDGQ